MRPINLPPFVWPLYTHLPFALPSFTLLIWPPFIWLLFRWISLPCCPLAGCPLPKSPGLLWYMRNLYRCCQKFLDQSYLTSVVFSRESLLAVNFPYNPFSSTATQWPEGSTAHDQGESSINSIQNDSLIVATDPSSFPQVSGELQSN